MPRYIDADALKDELELADFETDSRMFGGQTVLFEDSVFKIVDSAPTISTDDVRGVGKWTNKRTIEHDGEWWCTACGEEITIYMGKDRKDRYAFCPNCGAKMKGAEDGTTD